jgi:recombinational DNA repair protein (RecF pathway)
MTAKQEQDQETCIQCGSAVKTIYHPERGEMLCPKCSCEGAIWTGAAEHLHAMLELPARAWFEHWQAAGVDQDSLVNILETGLREFSENWVQSVVLIAL